MLLCKSSHIAYQKRFVEPMSIAMRHAEPITLAQFSRREIERENWLAQQREPMTLELDGVSLTVTPIAVEPIIVQGGEWVRIFANTAASELEIGIPAVPLLGFMSENMPDVALADVEPKILPLLIEESLSVLIANIERHFGPMRLSHAQLSCDALDTAHTAFLIEGFGPTPFPILLGQAYPRLSDIDRAIDKLESKPQPFHNIGFGLAFRIGFTNIALGELESLEVGDAIVIETTFIAQQKLVCVVAESFAQYCTFSQGSATLGGTLLTKPDSVTQKFILEQHMADPHTLSAGAPPASLREMQVRLVFEIGRLEVPLEQIETLSAGYTFDIGKQQQNVIDIIAGGRKIGTGDLVRVADSIGVRVTSLNR